MKEKVRFLGLDVHAETIAVAVAEPDGEVRSLGTIPNRAESNASHNCGVCSKQDSGSTAAASMCRCSAC